MNVLIRTDASVEIGSGHLMRCLTLADQLRAEGAEVAFVCCDLPGGMFDLLRARGYRSTRLSETDAGSFTQQLDAEKTIQAAAQLFPDGVDWLVVDHYGLDAAWERIIRPRAGKLMVIDDLANRKHDCDLLLDQNYYCDLDRRYQGLVPDTCITLLGPAYVLLRPEFAEARKKPRERDGIVRRILIFFGGSDPTNQTQKALEAIKLLNRPEIAVDVVVGAANPKANAVQALCAELPNVTYHCQVSNMAELMLMADIGIGAGGAAMWERCMLGLPTLTVVFAANQERTTADVAELGAVEYLGWANRFSAEDYARAIAMMLGDPGRVRQIGEAALGVLRPPAVSLAKVMQHGMLGRAGDGSANCFMSSMTEPISLENVMDKRLKKHPLGFWEIAAKPTVQELQQYYADKYYQEAKGSYELEYTLEELKYFRAKFEQRSRVLQHHLAPMGEVGRSLLDVGCGEGYALAFFREHGWSVKGIDFSSAGVASKNPTCMDVLETGDIFSLLNEEMSNAKAYDVVWLQNVLEHVIDPIDLLKALRTLVNPGGLAVVTVPNDCSITQRGALAHQHIGSAFWVAPPDHLSYFDPPSLGAVAHATGWECVEMLGDFPVDWFLFHPGSNYVRDKSAGKAAHKARVQIENLIHEQPIEDVLRFWSAAAKLGVGRDITAFLRPISK